MQNTIKKENLNNVCIRLALYLELVCVVAAIFSLCKHTKPQNCATAMGNGSQGVQGALYVIA